MQVYKKKTRKREWRVTKGIFAMQISIKTVEGKNIKLEVEDSSKPVDLKIYGPTRQLVLGLNPDAYPTQDAVMRIFVSTIKEKTFILQVKGSDTQKSQDHDPWVAYRWTS
ncbi:unnamed protein product [Brassica napus]|uniref:(rape) hypothetical protein n=1 Tax=Brassica napus TaxID=3708 RepID=A0A816M395_BRANA|nr:unnamed protein product [Brassica napus]